MDKSILIYGWYDSMNLGDDAMMITINNFLKSNNKNVVYYNFKDKKHNYFKEDLGDIKYYNRKIPKYMPNEIRVFKGIKKLVYWIKQIIFPDKELQKCDKVVFMGGGYINSIWSAELRNILHFSLVAKRNKCKIYFTGQTAGPYNNIFDKLFSKLLYNLGENVTVREKSSFCLLSKYNIKSLKLGADDFYLCKDNNKSTSNNEDKYFILTIKNFLNYEHGIEKCVCLAEEIYKQTGYTIALVPFGKGIRPEDFETSKQISNKLNNKKIKNIVVDINNFKQLESVFSNCEFTLGMAYHSLVISLFFNKPAIGLYNGKYYKSKITGILKHYDIEENSYDFEDVNNGNLNDIVKEIIAKVNNFDYIKSKNTTEDMKSICNKTWIEIIND